MIVSSIHELFNNASLPIQVAAWFQIDQELKKEREHQGLTNLISSGYTILIFIVYPPMMYLYLQININKLLSLSKG